MEHIVMNKRIIELSGHIIDSMALTKTMAIIMENGGEFDILEIEVGRKKSDVSYAKIEVQADSSKLLNSILDELSVLGASVDEIKEVNLVAATKDKVAPEGFYSSSNHVTHIFYNGNWIPVEDIEMDCLVVVDEEENRAFVKPIANIEVGDKIVTSNISDVYLPGIPVGNISYMEKDSNHLSVSGYITPSVNFDHISEVLVITKLKTELE